MIKVDAKFKKDGRTYLSIYYPNEIPFKVGQLVGFVINRNERCEYRVLGFQRQRDPNNVIIWVED